MEKFWLHGNFKKTPLAFLLFRIWKSNLSGSLKIKNQAEEKTAEFLRGHLAPAGQTYSGQDFLHHLVSINKITERQSQAVLEYAENTGFSAVRSLLEKELFHPVQLWTEMHLYLEHELFPIFDWAEAEFFFDSKTKSGSRIPFFLLNTPAFILNGIRNMSNIALMDAHLPSQDNKCILRSPEYIQTLSWNSPENYIIRLIQTESSAVEITKNSELSSNETKRVLFALRALEMIGDREKAAPAPDISSAEIQRIYEHFNMRFVHVFKFLDKEMGPVAFKVLEKCLMDVKSHLHPGFRNLRLESTGRIILGSTPMTPVGLPGGMQRKDFVGGLNEILNAEILLVKKNLGSDSESNLIKNLNSSQV
jgi:hypothetical protein